MGRWLITQNDSQFSVADVGELKEMARSGRLTGGDMIQPPGAADWVYAAEVPELSELLGGSQGSVDVDDFDQRSGPSPTMIMGIIFTIIIAIGGYYTWYYVQRLPTGQEQMIGDGGLSYSEMLVTSPNAILRKEPDAGASGLAGLEKDSTLLLLAKRGDFYRARNEAGVEGWVADNEVVPMYLFGGGDVREEYDPLYNPDRYTYVLNASWLLLPEQNKGERVTVFRFLLRNNSMYDMTGLKLLATVKDAKGHELDQVEFEVEGIIPANGETQVGTLKDEDPKVEDMILLTETTLAAMAEEDPDVYLRYTDGVDVVMESEDAADASVDIVELRAVPPEE